MSLVIVHWPGQTFIMCLPDPGKDSLAANQEEDIDVGDQREVFAT